MSKLEEMLKYVSEHNDFYKNRIKEYGIKDPLDITQWPVLTRKELQENRYNMFSDGGKVKYFNEILIRQNSSGSSGIPINVYWEYKDWYASNMSLWRKRLQWYGIKPKDKYVMFTLNSFDITTNDETFFYRNFPVNKMSVNTSMLYEEKDFVKIVEVINDYSPKWLYIQPYILERLLRVYRELEMNFPKSLTYIETVGELFSKELRIKAEEFFRIPIANMYGSVEMNGIAYECPNKHMHILDDNVYVECLSENGITRQGSGEAVITNLNNFVMPLIRYSQGDKIILDDRIELADCGLNSQVIKQIEGRSMDIIDINGIEINSQVIFESIAEVNNQYNEIIIDYTVQFLKSKNIILCKIAMQKSAESWFPVLKNALLKTIFSKNKMINSDNVDVVEGGFGDSSKKRRLLEIVE